MNLNISPPLLADTSMLYESPKILTVTDLIVTDQLLKFISMDDYV